MKYDFQIHRNEFRLRVLLTNKCNKNCNFCLNDFQSKEPEKHADPMDLMDCLRAYGQFMKFIGEESIVTFSGGEPGIYPFLDPVLKVAKHRCDTVKVVTNGEAFHTHRNMFVDKWHIGVTDKDDTLLHVAKNCMPNTVFQTVVTMDQDPEQLYDLVNYYHREGFLVKLFTDFRVDDPEMEILRGKVTRVAERFEDRICTRFTGVQRNRGDACLGCHEKCVTLKALWYFPDGTSSTCPQGKKKFFDDDTWDETMEKAYKLHKVEDI